MRRTSVFVTIAFVAGLTVSFFAQSAYTRMLLQKDTRAADLATIEKLHQIDIEATLSQDPKGLMDIWTEDAVRFNPGNPPAVGKQAIEAENAKAHAQYPGLKILSYTPKYKNIQIEDGLACVWSEREGEYKSSPESPPVSWHAKGLDLMRRQSDGSWKFAVLIGNQ